MYHSLPPRRVGPRMFRGFIFASAFGLIGWLILPEGLLNKLQPNARAASSFTVNSLGDTPDAVPGNGTCADASGNCTLRAAIQEANSLAGDDTISFSVTGTINLAAVLPDITSNMTMNGPGSGLLTVRRDTGGVYRIFSVNSGNVNITGLTMTNGRTPDSTRQLVIISVPVASIPPPKPAKPLEELPEVASDPLPVLLAVITTSVNSSTPPVWRMPPPEGPTVRLPQFSALRGICL